MDDDKDNVMVNLLTRCLIALEMNSCPVLVIVRLAGGVPALCDPAPPLAGDPHDENQHRGEPEICVLPH